MSEIKHTPGPWQLFQGHETNDIVVLAEKSEAYAKRYPNDGRQLLARVAIPKPFWDEMACKSENAPSAELLSESHANAQLIMAAPEMLQELELLQPVLQDARDLYLQNGKRPTGGSASDPTSEWARLIRAINAVHALTSKAKGEK